jgi:hypothetical protein
VNVLIRSLLLLALLSTATLAEPVDQIFRRLRALPSPVRVAEFSKLTADERRELFFVSNGRHPPYSGLDLAIAQQGAGFISQLRDELRERGGTPEVLDFLSIVKQMKRSATLTTQDIENLKLAGICIRASRSNYCPVLLDEILKP